MFHHRRLGVAATAGLVTLVLGAVSLSFLPPAISGNGPEQPTITEAPMATAASSDSSRNQDLDASWPPEGHPTGYDGRLSKLNPAKASCTDCHAVLNPGMHKQWLNSAHGEEDVGCADCHNAEPEDVDGFAHYGDTHISVVVTPKDCESCHEKQVAENRGSHHARGGEILASKDNLLGEVVGGPAAVNAGCRQCHGSEIEIGDDGRPTTQTWPNTGIGRINPDGSKGSCTACHGRHAFSRAQARTPDTCGKCHLGPDHPQKEVYEESKHGINYYADVHDMNLEDDDWVAGVDYYASATCTTCHMSAAPGLESTHNVGERISWTLRPPISTKINLVKLANGQKYDIPGEDADLPEVGDTRRGSEVIEVLSWEDRRNRMRTVCRACHSQDLVDGHYKQFDDVVYLYNNKFARPISAMMSDLKDRGIITATPFDDKIEWIWWEIWHHEGRRARHGASMNGPDYTWWEGIYEVAKHTYFALIPELKRVAGEEVAQEMLDKHFRPIAGHDWYFEGLDKGMIEKVRRGYEDRYGQGSFK